MTSGIGSVAVLGAGTMGHGIAQVAAMAGFDLTLNDALGAQLETALGRIRATLQKGVERGKVSAEQEAATLSRIRLVEDLRDAVAGADLVIEAVPERLDLKSRLFTELDELAPPHAILASNTSSLSISRIAAATKRADRVVGLHFFNPVHLMRLLEVVRGSETDGETVATAVAFAGDLGKEAIVVSDTPGFASSRLGVVLGLEAMRMVEEGVATAEDIDKAMELGYNHPMGPLRLTDLVGLDVRLGIAEYLHRELGGEQYRPPQILRRMVEEGRLGRKNGRGFYDWGEG